MPDTLHPHICKNCSNQFSGNYCNACGEKVYTQKDKKLSHLFGEAFHFVTHFEGTFFNTLKAIFTDPGKLSGDYCDGLRKKYFKPLSLFLLLVILYLFFPVFEGLNMKLGFYPQQKYYGHYAATKIQQKLTETGFTENELAEKFHAKSEKTSKFLLISIVPFTALIFYAIVFFKRRYFFDHVVFSAEINSFYLLWGFLILPFLLVIFIIAAKWITGQNNISVTDEIIGWLIYVPLVIYTALASHRFYGFKYWHTIIFCTVFYFAQKFIVYSLYKFLLFVTVINQIH